LEKQNVSFIGQVLRLEIETGETSSFLVGAKIENIKR